jgi:hypothetical protein
LLPAAASRDAGETESQNKKPGGVVAIRAFEPLTAEVGLAAWTSAGIANESIEIDPRAFLCCLRGDASQLGRAEARHVRERTRAGGELPRQRAGGLAHHEHGTSLLL